MTLTTRSLFVPPALPPSLFLLKIRSGPHFLPGLSQGLGKIREWLGLWRTCVREQHFLAQPHAIYPISDLSERRRGQASFGFQTNDCRACCLQRLLVSARDKDKRGTFVLEGVCHHSKEFARSH